MTQASNNIWATKIRMPKPLHEELVTRAKKIDVSVNYLVVMSVKYFLSEQPVTQTNPKEQVVMEFTQYIRQPFTVEAVQITAENLEEVAKLVGEVRTDVRNKKETTYIALDRRIVPNVSRAYLGWYLTRLEDNYRCYSAKVFREQFVEYCPVMEFVFTDGEEEVEAVV